MSLKSRVADLITRGEFTKIQVENQMLRDDLGTQRPGLGLYEAQGTAIANTLLGLAYYLESEVAAFSDMVLILKRELFRRGFEWKPTFACKCSVCGAKYDKERDICDCGSADFTKPDRTQIKLFEKPNGKTFLDEANENGMSLKQVLQDYEFHLEVGDNAYLICRKSYIYSSDGTIFAGIPKEFISVDPRIMRKIHDKVTGLPGANTYVCPEHRDQVVTDAGEKIPPCKKCGKPLVQAYYETIGQVHTYYLKDEVCHNSKYYPSLLYGFPPILKILDDAFSYHHLEKRERRFYERGRAPGIMVVPTSNPASLRKFWKETNEELKKDYYYLPIMSYELLNTAGKATAQYIKLMDDPNPEMLEVKKELRERMGSRFGVSLVLQADTSTSGGLNNEGLQYTVTNRAVEDGQAIYNDNNVLHWVCHQFGMTDFVAQVKPNEEQDEMAEKQRFNQDVTNAKMMQDMGFEVIYENGEFSFTGKAFIKDQYAGLPGLPNPDDEAGGEQRNSGEPDKPEGIGRGDWQRIKPGETEAQHRGMGHDTREGPRGGQYYHKGLDAEDIDDLDEDTLIKDYAEDALQAVQSGALFPYYKNVPDAAIATIHAIIKDAFLSHRLSLREMIKAIIDRTGLDFNKARIIARTESSAVANKAREIGWIKMQNERGEVFLFKPVITFDNRTSDVSKEIAKRFNEMTRAKGTAGLPIDELKMLYKEVSQEFMGEQWQGWQNFVAHPYERDTIVRVVDLSKAAYSVGQDNDGVCIYTHRARSKSYPSLEAIPERVKEFIASTA